MPTDPGNKLILGLVNLGIDSSSGLAAGSMDSGSRGRIRTTSGVCVFSRTAAVEGQRTLATGLLLARFVQRADDVHRDAV